MDITVEKARELLGLPSGLRPRIYADIVSGVYAGQRVAIRSLSNLDSHAGTIGGLAISVTSISDIVKGANN